MPAYDVINLTNTRNDDIDYEVNDAHYTGIVVEFDDNPSLDEIIAALQNEGCLSDKANTKNVSVHEWQHCIDSDSITLRDKENGLWLYELRPKID